MSERVQKGERVTFDHTCKWLDATLFYLLKKQFIDFFYAFVALSML